MVQSHLCRKKRVPNPAEIRTPFKRRRVQLLYRRVAVGAEPQRFGRYSFLDNVPPSVWQWVPNPAEIRTDYTLFRKTTPQKRGETGAEPH
jgi:hypothetical protein